MFLLLSSILHYLYYILLLFLILLMVSPSLHIMKITLPTPTPLYFITGHG